MRLEAASAVLPADVFGSASLAGSLLARSCSALRLIAATSGRRASCHLPSGLVVVTVPTRRPLAS